MNDLTEKQTTTSLFALNFTSRKKLSNYLNIECESISDVMGDFHGLAELIGFDYIEIRNFERHKNPTDQVLAEWTSRPDLEPTVGKLMEYLREMNRFDIITDCLPIIIKDIEAFEKRTNSLTSPVQVQQVSQSSFPTGHIFQEHNVNETSIMSTDDVKNGSPTYYDAFLCFNPEGPDFEFARKLLDILEKPPHNLRLFVPGRNDLPGSSGHTISASLIEKRCKRMVIILSPRYLKSDACDFQTKFAFCLSPGSRNKKLVPILIENCTIPPILKFITLCDYTKEDLQEWIWDRVACAIKAPLQGIQWENKVSIQDITLDISSHYDQIPSGSSHPSSSTASTSLASMSPSPISSLSSRSTSAASRSTSRSSTQSSSRKKYSTFC